jgi:DNA-binding transcriptional regulator GbsR (MarR family)
MNLSPLVERFVLHWGEMGTRWGVNRTMSQIHALLYITGRPMNADELVEALGVARSNVSTSLRELQSWNLVRLVHLPDDRRDHFETSTAVWDLLRTIVRERQRREIDPTVQVLRELLAAPPGAREPPAARTRVGETLELLETLTAWSEEMLRLDTQTLARVLKLGAGVQRYVRRGTTAKARRGAPRAPTT